ncbi:hypothetical protein A9K55_005705 [Cordyceps militaris]|uniref:C2H2-type domain-containing protein n=1 Tax=Cordyceps militaris TaxID=73501 RepID=A0A2H4SA67_CORMI|nr:hypothetical protein A9K55_005705 [Cordyceps militaris]
MSSTIASSPIDGAQESDFIDSRNPSRQTSYHENDLPAFSPQNYIWPAPLLPVNQFTLQHVQSLESVPTALSAPSSLISDPSIPYYAAYPPILPADPSESFAMCQQAGPWTTLSSDTASVDLIPDLHAGLHRTDSDLSADSLRRNACASFPVEKRSKSPLKGDSDHASRSRSIVGLVSPPPDAGVKKLRKSVRGCSSRRHSIALTPSAANIKASMDVHARRHSPPAKEEVVSNDELLSSEDEDSRHRPKNAGKEFTFACPFYRRWPTRHIECMSRKLTRIQDVKQHIYRRHSKPPFYCPTCAKVFVSPDPRDDHIRQASCRPVTASSKRSSDGISAQVQDSLKNRFARKLSAVEQWYGIWDLVFPGEAAPPNAYVGSVVTEMLSMLKDFWKNEGQRILPSIPKPKTGRSLADEDLQMLMTHMLDKVKDHFEDEPDLADATAADGADSQMDQVMDSSPVDGEFGTFAEYEETSYEPSRSSGWETVAYSPNRSPLMMMGGRIVESTTDLGSSGMLVEHHQPFTEQLWTNNAMTNHLVNGFQ